MTPENTENTMMVPKKHPKKLKVRHLSELAKRLIMERYCALMDFDETAVSMQIPGLTGKTVENVVVSAMLPTRRPPTREISYIETMQQRRTA